MPIPMSNQRPEVRTPRVNTPQALNLAQNVEAATKMYKNIADTATKAVNNVSAAIQTGKNADDLNKGSQVWNEYYRQMENLNSKRDSLGSVELKNFEGEYTKTANGYYADALVKLNNIHNREIRENFVSKMRSYNDNNAETTFLKFDKAGRDIQESTSNDNIDTSIAMAEKLFGEDRDSMENSSNMLSLYDDIEAEYKSGMIARGEYDPSLENATNLTPYQEKLKKFQEDRMKFGLMEKKEKALLPILERINYTTKDPRPWHQFDESIKLVEDMQAAGQISDDFAIKTLKNLETKMVSVEYKRNPDQFYDPTTGRFLYENRPANVKYLDPDEYEKACRTIKEVSNRNPRAGARLGAMSDAMNKIVLKNDEQFREQYGLLYDEEIKKRFHRLPDEEASAQEKAFVEDQKKRRKAANSTVLINHLATLQKLRDTVVYTRIADGELVSHNDNGEQILFGDDYNAIVENASLPPNDPNRIYEASTPFYTSELDEVIEKAWEQLNAFYSLDNNGNYLNDKTDFKVVSDNRGLFGRLFIGNKRFSVEEVVNASLHSMFTGEVERAKKSDTDYGPATPQFDADGYTTAVVTAINHIRNGDTILSNNVLGVNENGKPIYGRTLSRTRLNNKYDDLQSANKADVLAAIYAALAETLPKERFNDFINNDDLVKNLSSAVLNEPSVLEQSSSVFNADTKGVLKRGNYPVSLFGQSPVQRQYWERRYRDAKTNKK